MVDALARELVLPATRLDVPPRPSRDQLSLLADRSLGAWTASPLEWTHQVVVRLAVARLLGSQLAAARPERRERLGLGDDATVTLGQVAGLFRPHVWLSEQAFRLVVVDAINAGVPAAADPVREGLRRLGVTGREPLHVAALGLEKVPARARGEFWSAAATSATLTAVVDRLIPAARAKPGALDVSSVDRSELARADALVYSGTGVTPLRIGSSRPDGETRPGSWLHVPLTIGRPDDGGGRPGRHTGPPVAEVTLRAGGWVEAFVDALDAVSIAAHVIDQGNPPRGRRGSALARALGGRLAAARDRTLDDVVAGLRDVDEVALEMFDHQVSASSAPLPVPALEDDTFLQLWLPTAATAGPLVVGAADLFFGAGSDVRLQTGQRPEKRTDKRPEKRTDKRPEKRTDQRSDPRSEQAPGKRPSKRRRKPKPAGAPPTGPEAGPEAGPEVGTDSAALPSPEPTAPPTSEPTTQPTPEPTPEPSPEPSPES